MTDFIKKLTATTIVFTFAFIVTLHLNNVNSQKSASAMYVIKSYKNTVALYRNDEIIKTYDNIVLNTLPQTDIKSFNVGIIVSTPTQADIYLEDFES